MNIVVLGGGTGQSILLKGLKQISGIKISAIVTVADDGGSTGRIRETYAIPAVGDIRNVIVALAESENTFSDLMNYRFEGDDDLKGHSLGNLILLALTQQTGNFVEAISRISNVLRVKGDIIPSTLEVVTLFATMEDGTIVRGESNIPKAHNHISRVYYDRPVQAYRKAIEAIEQADIIIYGIGSLYTSIMPNVIIPEIKAAIQQSRARKVYFCNVMSQNGETDGYSLEDHVNAIMQHVEDGIDEVVVAADDIPPAVIANYESMEQYLVLAIEPDHAYQLRGFPLLKFENRIIRHDPDKVKKAFEVILKDHIDVVRR